MLQSPVNNLHSSFFLHIMHDHTHQYSNHMGESGVCIIPTSIESLPHTSFLEKQWRMFIRQMDRTQQLLNSIIQKPLAPPHLISTLQAELTNLDSIYTSCRPLILVATQLLKKEHSFDRVSASIKCRRRSLLPFLGDALSSLTGRAMTKDVSGIKKRVNQLIATQHNQQETLAHVISILNITRYATGVNRQHINIVINAAERMHQDVTTLYNITHSLSY